MKVQLLVSEWCAPCDKAEEIWRAVAEQRAIQFEVLDMAQPEGREVARRLGIRTIPSVVIDDQLKALGVVSHSAALELVAGAPERKRAALRHVGLVMETSSRAAVLAAVGYLFIFGGLLFAYGGVPAGAALRLVTIHFFTLGFIAFMLYGLGEHLLPRFTGSPIRLGAWSWAQQSLAHAGLVGLAAGSLFGQRSLASLGAALAWCALLLFALRILPVLWPGLPGASR